MLACHKSVFTWRSEWSRCDNKRKYSTIHTWIMWQHTVNRINDHKHIFPDEFSQCCDKRHQANVWHYKNSKAFYLSFLHLSHNMKCRPKKTRRKLLMLYAMDESTLNSRVFVFIPLHGLLRACGLLDGVWEMASYSGPDTTENFSQFMENCAVLPFV